MSGEKVLFGKSGELCAEKFLTAKGYEILERNFRCGRYGEIDLIVKKDNTTVFVEVRSRKGSSFGGAVNSITAAKKRKIQTVARSYLQRYGAMTDYRFDLVLLQDGTIEWIQDIIR
jgi:putative endonuclease